MKTYPFDSSIKHHFIIAAGLAVWVFVFLYFTEPLDTNELGDREKLVYLPLYGLVGASCYIMSLPLQNLIYKKANLWQLMHELLFTLFFLAISLLLTRSFYLYVVIADEPNPYTLDYYITDIFIPAILTILPIVLAGRYAFGRYANKKLEAQKIEIQGEGNYESLRLLWTDLISIQSSDNYVDVSFQKYGETKKHLIRSKLSVVEKQFPDLLRTHRSFLINPYHFRSWKTENAKLFIVLSNDEIIPISKTYATAVKLLINSATK